MDDDEEMKKRLLQAIVDSFNKIGMMAMNQLANGNDGFTISNGPWTVTLDLGDFLESGGCGKNSESTQSSEDEIQKTREIMGKLVEPWHNKIKKRGRKTKQ